MSTETIETTVSPEDLQKTQDTIINSGGHGLILSNGHTIVLLISRKSSLCLITKDSIDILYRKYKDKEFLRTIAMDLINTCGGEIIGEL